MPTTSTPTTSTPTSVTQKTYTPLIELPDVLIGRCSQILPNRLQCWKAGDYLVKENLTPPTPPPATPTSTTPPATTPPPKEGPLKTLEHKIEAEVQKITHPSLKQQQGEPLGQPGSGTTSDQKEQQAASGETKSVKEPQTRSYQLCTMHAVIQQRADMAVQQDEAAGKSTPPDDSPDSIHSKMLQAQQRARTSNLPVGEKTAQG